MKTLKRIIPAIIMFLIAVVLFRGPLYRFAVTYRSIDQRANYVMANSELIRYIEESVSEMDSPDVREIIKSSLAVTSGWLTFSFSDSYSNPDRLIEARRANCIGYAMLFAAVFNYQFEKYRLDDRWVATPEAGQLYLFGLNVHNWFDTPFFKDHDFVLIKNSLTGEYYAVDPSVNDYLCIDFVKFKPSAENRTSSNETEVTKTYPDEVWWNDENEYPYPNPDTIEFVNWGGQWHNGTDFVFYRDNRFEIRLWRYSPSIGLTDDVVVGNYMYTPEAKEIVLDFAEQSRLKVSLPSPVAWFTMEGLGQKTNRPRHEENESTILSRAWMKIVESSDRMVRVELWGSKTNGELISFGEQIFSRKVTASLLNRKETVSLFKGLF